MEGLFVPYDLAVKLKELGFKEKCFAKYRSGSFQFNVLGKPIDHNTEQIVPGDVSAPLWQQAFLFIYKISNSKTNITIQGNDNYKTLSEKLEQAIKNIRDL